MSSDSKRNSFNLQNDDVEGEKILTEPIYPSGFVKGTILKIDLRMLPLLGLLYAIAIIDRTNLGIARTAGMEADLKLNIGDRYSIASMIYFIPYILLQLPGNLALRWLGARTWLTVCVVGWGVAQVGMGFVKTWGQLCIARVFLGVFEAGFFPALVFIITTWYKRHEVQTRLAIFYLISIMLNGFSSLLAYALTLLKGKGHLAGWQWIFVIEGLMTIILGILAFFFVPDFPDKNRFLTSEQTKVILDRVERDRGDSMPDEITLGKILTHLSDWTLWAYALMFMCSTMPAYAIGFFITTILHAMGYSTTMALILTAPPYVFATVSCFLFAILSDKTKKRALWLSVQACIATVGLLLTAYAKPSGVRYFGLFLTTAGTSGCVPSVLAYQANNIVSHSKRAVWTAVTVAFGGIGGIFATTVYRQKDFPRYLNGIWATIGCQVLIVVLCTALTLNYMAKNKRARDGKGANEGTPGFYYTI
ncbi:MFS general substrate transporter [Macrolepiota fuliginosa MF-IS2]|uniref:MFS general substrate transporter n=1 Tax=Macrolepiota fuliginosa MF-IS2 TaxID=1400762 RepID=A0A9P6C8B1_9AGAR|nr:MFS general substrate transporter [Macrolepiota fuliginosa MF-IS2]